MDKKDFLEKVFVYYKILDNVNIYLNKIIDCNYNGNPYQVEEWFFILTTELMRLFPFKIDKKLEKVEMSLDDGIMLLKKEIPFILEKFNKICSHPYNEDILKNIIIIRNKYTHEPHNIKYRYSTGSNTSCFMGLYYKTNKLNIDTISIGSIVKYINKVFSQIDTIVLNYFNEKEELKTYLIYEEFLKMIDNRGKYHYAILPQYNIWNF